MPNVEMEIGSNEAIKQAIVAFRIVILVCHALSTWKGTKKVHFYDGMEGFFNPTPLYVYPASKTTVRCRLHLFLEYLLMKVSRLAEQTTLEFMQKTQGILSEILNNQCSQVCRSVHCPSIIRSLLQRG